MEYGICNIAGNVIAKFVAPVTVRSNVPVFVSDTLSLSRHVSKRSAQRWEIEASVEPLSTTANELFVSLVTKGHYETVDVNVPQNYAVIVGNEVANASNTPYAATAGNANATSVTLGTAFNNTCKLLAGTFIKFSGHTKVYMLTADATGGTLYIFPGLFQSVAGNSLIFKDVKMTCYYDTDTISGMSYSDGILMNMGTIKLVEKV